MKALFLTQLWPEQNASGASTRTLQLIQFFLHRGWQVNVWSDAEPNGHEQVLRDVGCQTLRVAPNDDSFDAELVAVDPQMVVFDRFSMEEKFSFRILRNCPNALRVLDTVDLHSVRLARGKQIKQFKQLKEQGDAVLCCPDLDFESYTDQSDGTWERELAAILRSDLVLVVSDYERDLLVHQLKVPQEILLLCRLTYPPRMMAAPGFEERQGFVALGCFRHPPNVDAFNYLSRIFWPRLRGRLPNAILHVWGSHMGPSAPIQSSRQAGIFVKGHAPSAFLALEQARVHLALVRYGAGIKSKISDSFFAGTPSVTTRIGAEGMLDGADFPGFVSSALDEAIEHAVLLHEDKTVWQEKASLCGAVLHASYDEKSTLKPLEEKVNSILQNLPGQRRYNPLGRVLWHQSFRSTEYFSRWIQTKQVLAEVPPRGAGPVDT
jgi:hypothetical protein